MRNVLALASERDFDEPRLVSEVVYGLLMQEGGVENFLWKPRPGVVPGEAAPPRRRHRHLREHSQHERSEDEPEQQ
jgi:hypothetical protein